MKKKLELLSYKGNQIAVQLVFSKRKTIALYVYQDGRIELRAPLRCTKRDADAFLQTKLDWILQKQEQFKSRPQPILPDYVDGAEHFYLGHRHRLTLVKGKRKWVEKHPDSILLRLPDPKNQEKVKALLLDWYKKMALLEFPDRLQSCYQQMSQLRIPDPHLKVRKMKARWGSCSRSAEICLNSLLIQKPEAAIDYVITHELCHLREFSHNKAFYQLLSSVMPDWKERRVLLA